ncbi:hypothetical protein QVD17_03090 [Tagetes erecta]|uniref:Uncharacterized protein n=1 Tax=Tagetes erecta TaxID=13708 RepID=A0AAD8L7R7_TARER|nr:hypothetical protein QVD17_03090 [Tagetes erecta]
MVAGGDVYQRGHCRRLELTIKKGKTSQNITQTKTLHFTLSCLPFLAVFLLPSPTAALRSTRRRYLHGVQHLHFLNICCIHGYLDFPKCCS